jgi:anti-sigma factor RsiW
MTEMVCNELVEVITDYLEDALPVEERRRFEAHLGECPFCVSYVEQMRATVARLGVLSDATLAADARGGVLDAFRGWRGR